IRATLAHRELPGNASFRAPKTFWLQNVLVGLGEEAGRRGCATSRPNCADGRNFMHKTLLAGVSAIAIALTSGAGAQELIFPKGEGAFSWDALQQFADSHQGLQGQSLTIWGPWREGGDQEQFESVLA